MTTTDAAIHTVEIYRAAQPAPLAHNPEPSYYITAAELDEHYRKLSLATNTDLTLSDVDWFATWAPEVLEILEPFACSRFVYVLNVEVYGNRSDFLDDCEFFGWDPEDPEDVLVFEDEGLSGIVVVSGF